ncbi:hypothetical protein Tco_0704718 [Tanacetum coccineum]|uniref:Uncharacterized protein n=1 Tax=Tanacetum coccineum TaxID=301880 RepID=A0ABQ4Y4E8_9ASTR
MIDEYFQPYLKVVSLVPPIAAPIPVDTTGLKEQLQPTQFDNDPFINIFTLEPISKESSSRDVIPSNLQQINQPFDHIKKWTKDHPLDNVIGNLSRLVLTRRQLQIDAMW